MKFLKKEAELLKKESIATMSKLKEEFKRCVD